MYSVKNQQTHYDFSNLTLPSDAIVILDLDYTVWNAYIEFNVEPFTPIYQGDRIKSILDKHNDRVRINAAIYDLFDVCERSNVPVCVASLSPATKTAHAALADLEFSPRLKHIVARSSPSKNKIAHFEEIFKALNVSLDSYDKVLFFDDEVGNFKLMTAKGCTVVHCQYGLSQKNVYDGILEFNSK